MTKTSAVLKTFGIIAALAVIAGAIFLFSGYAEDFSEPEYKSFTVLESGKRLLDKEYTANPRLRAYTSGGDMTIADVYRNYIDGGMERSAVLDFMYDGLGTELEEIFDGLKKPAVDAATVFSAGKKERFAYTDEQSGSEVDREAFYAALENSLDGESVELTALTREVKASVTKADLIERTKLRGTFVTMYRSSGAGRRANIALAAGSVSGTILESGESFSFNGVVGERTSARGYKEANIIVDGTYVRGVGGGVCQVSTTLYNCALLSGLNVTAWSRHTLASSYVKPSFDAMVSNTTDLCFTNTTAYPIYIEMIAEGGKLTSRIFGEGLEEGTEIKLVSKVLKELKPSSYNVVYDDTMYEDESKVLVSAHKGYISEGYLVTYNNGKLVSSQKLRHDEYRATAGTMVKGTKRRKHDRADKSDQIIDSYNRYFD